MYYVMYPLGRVGDTYPSDEKLTHLEWYLKKKKKTMNSLMFNQASFGLQMS